MYDVDGDAGLRFYVLESAMIISRQRCSHNHVGGILRI